MKKVLYIFIFLVIATSAKSQISYISFQYPFGFTVGNTRDFITATSFRGFTIDYRNFVKPNIGVGFDMGWNVFYEQRPYDTYTKGTLSVSGKQYRYANHVPLLVCAGYYIDPSAKFSPFVGFGLGTMYSLRNTDMNMYTYELDAWHFAIRPELGVVFNSQENVGVSVTGKYYYGVKAGDLPAQGYITLNLGILFYKY
jgi:hypothetical protein